MAQTTRPETRRLCAAGSARAAAALLLLYGAGAGSAALASPVPRAPSAATALAELYELAGRAEEGEGSGARRAEGALEAALAAPAPGARADLAALRTILSARIALATQGVPQARAVADPLAPIRSWAVVGPFDNEGRAGLSAIYPPEREPPGAQAEGASYPGKEHSVAWRTLPDPGPLDEIDLSSAIAPRQAVTVYGATVLRSDREQEAILHLGASGACKLWLDGSLVHEDAAQHPARFDQAAIAVRLKKGDNGLLLKLAHSTGRLALRLRLADAQDRPLPLLALAARSPLQSPAQPGGSQEAARWPGPGPQPDRRARLQPADAVAELRAWVRERPADAAAWGALAVLLEARRPYDETEPQALLAAERAAALQPTDPATATLYARLQAQEPNLRRGALERAQAAHPQDAGLLSALVRFRLDRGDGWKALALADRLLATVGSAPGGGPAEGAPPLDARLLHARALDAVGLPYQAARERLQATLGRQEPRAIHARCAALRRLGRADETRPLLEALLARRPADGEARGELLALRTSRGDLDGAAQLLGQEIAQAPLRLSPLQRLAELLSQAGRAAAADEAFVRARRLAPDDPDLHEAIGRHLLRAAPTDPTGGAQAAFARSLALRPQNPQVRELLRSLHPEERYAAPYLADAAGLLALPRLAGPEEDVEVVENLTVVKVWPNGLSSRTRQLLLRPLTQRGVDQARTQSVQFAPDRQAVQIERARLLRPDGTVFESRSEGDRSLNDPWIGMYYDLRARVISFPQLQPGDLLELVSRVDDVGRNFFADQFGDFAFLQGSTLERRAEYVLLAPAGRTFFDGTSNLPGLTRSEERLPDGGQLLRFAVRDAPRIPPEPGPPGPSEVYGWVHLSTFPDWAAVGRFYWGLVKDQLRVTEEIRKAAAEAVAGVPPDDERGRIAAAYRFVLEKTRYVALEFGINSFKPYPVETILSRRFGDCKDKASLLHALLAALGIDSRLVLLRMRRLGGLPDLPASLSVFNHAILYVPKYDLFLDGTAEFHGSRELPGDDRGALALVVEPQEKQESQAGQGAPVAGARLVRTPEAQPEENVDQLDGEVDLAADGSARLQLAFVSAGSHAPEGRRSFESPDERKVRAEERLGRGAYPGARVESVEVSDPHAIERPFELRVTASMAGFAQVDPGGGLRLTPFGRRHRLVELLAPLSARTLPLRLPDAQRSTLRTRLRLPAGSLVRPPDPIAASSRFGRFAVRFQPTSDGLLALAELELAGGVVEAAAYPAYREFLGQLDQALLQPIAVGRAPSPLADGRAP